METSQVESQVEGAVYAREGGGIADLDLRPDASLLKLSPGKGNGARGEVHAGDLPPGPGQGDHIRAGAASDVNGAAGFMTFDEFKQFGGTRTRIPGGLTEIPVMEEQAAK